MAPQVSKDPEMWGEQQPQTSGRTVVTKLVLVASVVAATTLALYSFSSVAPVEVETAVNPAVGDDLTRAKSDCACLDKCSATADSEGLHHCSVGTMNCIGIDYKKATVAKGVTSDSDCKDKDGKPTGKCTAVCEFVQGKYDCWSFPCLNGGFCTDGANSYKCHCAFGYTGTNCERDINECEYAKGGADYPCHKHSLCVNSDGKYSCECRTGWEGDGYITKFNKDDKKTNVKNPYWLDRSAEGADKPGCTDMDDCASNPCMHGSTCTNLVALDYKLHGYECACVKTHLGNVGWDGKQCESNINECALVDGKKNDLNDCDPESTCHDTEGSFTCACNEHWTEYDKVPEKLGGPFNHKGHDGRTDTSKKEGGGDEGCYDHDDCASQPCKNGATCHEGPPGCKIEGKCSKEGATSKAACEKAGGKWNLGPGLFTMVDCFTCTCSHGWSGFTCEKDENECATDAASRSDKGVYKTPVNTCNENALCTNLPGSYSCSCNLGWTGTGVTHAKGKGGPQHFPKGATQGCWDANDCEFNPCAHGGTCTDCGTLCIYCECVPGWRGTTCETDWNECLMGIHRCSNDATCVNTPGSYACKCDRGFTGDGIGNAVEELKIKFKVNGVQKEKEVIHGCKDIDDCIHDHHYVEYPKRLKEVQEKQDPTCKAKDEKKAADVDKCKAVKAISLKEACKKNDKCEYDYESKNCPAKDTSIAADVTACKKIKATTFKENCDAAKVCNHNQPDPVVKMVKEGEGPCIHGTCTTGKGPMAYSCRCNTGWQDTNCDNNVNECMRETACHRFADCTDQEGTYTCKCKPGYVGDGKNCVDANDCKGQCKHGFCTDLGVNDFHCHCNNGWEDKLCDSDVDECAEFTHGCGNNAICTNKLALVKLGADMRSVVGEDKWNEAQKGTPDGTGYTCKCDTGFNGEPYKPGNCQDIDDCSVKELGMKCLNGKCRDTGANSYICTCTQGWQDFNCDFDINECFTGVHDCVAEARCVNLPGAYKCRCLSGWGGDGFKDGAMVAGKKVQKRKGHRMNAITKLAETVEDGGGCHDLNDCVPEPCDTAHGKCVDRGANKYECVCQDGWGCNPNPKEKTCATDCDECADGFGYPAKNACAKGGRSTCTNNPMGRGGYSCKCNYPEITTPGNPNGKGWFGDGRTCMPCQICDAGYTPQGDCKKEDRKCINKDECTLDIHNCDLNANCADTDGSFTCTCKQDGVPTTDWLGNGRADEWFGKGIQQTCNRCTRCYPGYREVSPCTSTLDRKCESYIPTGLYMIESEADDNRECLRLDPKMWYPTRFDAGNGVGFCGLGGGKKAVAKDSTLAWRLTQLAENDQLWQEFPPQDANKIPEERKWLSDLYTIESAADGAVWKCLFFGDNGNDMYPSLQNCKDGEADCPWDRPGKPFCGFVDRASLINNRQAVWKITPIKFIEKKFIVQNRKRAGKNGGAAWNCLVFEKNGAATNPSRYNWGNGDQYCGAGDWEGLGHKVALMTNKQAIFIITAL